MLAVDKLNVIRQVAAAMLSVVQQLVVITPPPIAEYCDEPVCVCKCVCVCVCFSVRDDIFGTTPPIFNKFFVHVTCGRGSVLLWRRSDMSCTSGFMDDY